MPQWKYFSAYKLTKWWNDNFSVKLQTGIGQSIQLSFSKMIAHFKVRLHYDENGGVFALVLAIFISNEFFLDS